MSSNKDEMYVKWENSWINLSNGERIKGIEKPVTPTQPATKITNYELEDFIINKSGTSGNPPFLYANTSELVNSSIFNQGSDETYRFCLVSYKEVHKVTGTQEYILPALDRSSKFFYLFNKGSDDHTKDVLTFLSNDFSFAGDNEGYGISEIECYSFGTYQELDYIFARGWGNINNALIFCPNAKDIMKEGSLRFTNCIIVVNDESKINMNNLIFDDSSIIGSNSPLYNKLVTSFKKWMEKSVTEHTGVENFITSFKVENKLN